MLRAALPIALAATLLAGTATPDTAAAKTPVTCANAGKTLVKTKSARIYRQTVRTGDIKEPRTYGCWLPTRDRLRLDLRCDPDDGSPEGDDACHDTPSDWAVNGRYVAITFDSYYESEGGASYSTVIWARLRKPARQEVVDIENNGDSHLGPFFEKLYISKLGGIAYSATDVDEEQVIGYVAPFKPGNEVDGKTLDSGPKVDAESLAIAGDELRWTNDGVVKTAPWK